MAAKYTGITVEELHGLVKEQIAKGNGDKSILISTDDEGNGFHTLFYGFEDNYETLKEFKGYGLFHDDNDPRNVVILG